jgi:hypothetical protein
MKIDIKIGEHDVAVEATPLSGNVIQLSATCGETTCHHNQTMHPKHDRTDEHLRKDIEDAAQLLAEEAAGHEQSRKLTEQLFSEK